jgi:hypothetical protein
MQTKHPTVPISTDVKPSDPSTSLAQLVSYSTKPSTYVTGRTMYQTVNHNQNTFFFELHYAPTVYTFLITPYVSI